MPLRNKFPGRCSCGTFVPPGKGFVIGRRIACADHGGEAMGTRDQERDASRTEFEDREIYGFDDF